MRKSSFLVIIFALALGTPVAFAQKQDSANLPASNRSELTGHETEILQQLCPDIGETGYLYFRFRNGSMPEKQITEIRSFSNLATKYVAYRQMAYTIERQERKVNDQFGCIPIKLTNDEHLKALREAGFKARVLRKELEALVSTRGVKELEEMMTIPASTLNLIKTGGYLSGGLILATQ